MTEEKYRKIEIFFRKHKRLYFLLRIIYKYLPYPVYVIYPLMLILTFTDMINNSKPEAFIITLTVPATAFLSVTILRRIINRPRPYEALKINPLIKKNTVGKSFPSRHSASVFIIATVCFPLNTALGITLTVLGTFICVSRVLAGVHYISDVVFGALFSIVLGVFSIFLI